MLCATATASPTSRQLFVSATPPTACAPELPSTHSPLARVQYSGSARYVYVDNSLDGQGHIGSPPQARIYASVVSTLPAQYPGSRMSSGTPSRYRLEAGKPCIDIKLSTVDQLFDGRDPAPFRGRDLDEKAVVYILDAVQEIPRKSEFNLVLWIAEDLPAELPAATVCEGVRSHFTYEVEQLDRGIRSHVRAGQFKLLVGLLALTLFLSLAELTSMMAPGHIRQILREGLVIIGWVALWRPLDALLYDWWPLVQQRRLHARVLRAEVRLSFGSGPTN